MSPQYPELRQQPATAKRLEMMAGPAPRPAIPTYFQQSCPTCGRVLLVLVQHLGREVFCEHCHSGFISSDGSRDHHGGSVAGLTIMERAERLLALLESSP